MLKVEYLDITDLKPYENNAKIHTPEQIEQIKQSIKEFGMNDPIGIWGKDNLIVEGHGRLTACKELGMKEVPVIRLDDLTDEQRRAYTLIHNQTTMNTGFDIDILNEELESIDIDMSDYGFELEEIDTSKDDKKVNDETYTKKTDIPQYEIKGENPNISDLIDKSKAEELIKNIDASNISDEQKEFLRLSAYRHLKFNYSKIAEYYAHQSRTVQELMEESALVLIDFDDAIKKGFVEIKKELGEILENEE